MDLIVHFNKKILREIHSSLSEVTNMNSIGLVHFCSALLKAISNRDGGGGGTKMQMDDYLYTMLCQIFDCVDVDSRGFINWEDFVAFALRSGRNNFKPLSGYVNVEYIQRMDVNSVIPVKKLFHCAETGLIYAFDGDSPVVRLIRHNGDQIGTFNPNIGITRLIKVRQQGKQPYFAQKNTAKQDAGKLKKKKESSVKQTVTSMAWIERKRQMVFATSNCYISFWNYRLVHLIDFVETAAPQLGMLYSNCTDLLLTWGGDIMNYDYCVWDCNSRTLRYQFNKHRSIILTTVEISNLDAIVSSSMDRSLYVWPVSKLLQSRDSTFDEHKLSGHTYAIRSVCFAPENDFIIGAGFDFDIFCWDPTTFSLQMKLVGHRLSIVGVAVINNPFERAASIDESGTVRVWNLDRGQGLRGSHLQSIAIQGAVPNHVSSFISAYNGTTLAVLSERLLFLELTASLMEDNRIVTGGLSICEYDSRIILTSRRSCFEFSLINDESGKVYQLISEECIETSATAKLVSDAEIGIAKRGGNKKPLIGEPYHDEVKEDDGMRAQRMCFKATDRGSRTISPDDDTTCVTSDQSGKKLFVGTNSGRVLLYDGTSMGLLAQLSYEEDLSRKDDHNSSGAVIQLRYCEKDEVLVAAYAGGSLKVFNGCHRVVTEDITTSLQTKDAEDVAELMCPYFQGGGPPQAPFLLRQNSRVHETTVVALDASDKLGLIAVSAVDGTVRVFDYHSLLIRAIYAAPFVGSQPVEVIHLCFVPLAPVLLGADSNGRFTCWTVYPMKPLWILTWSLPSCFNNIVNPDTEEDDNTKTTTNNDDDESILAEKSLTGESTAESKRKAFRKRRSSVASFDSLPFVSEDEAYDEVETSSATTCMRCVVWKAKVAGKKKKRKVNWNVIVGEANGMISIIDLTEVLEKLGLHDFRQLKHAYQLNSSAMVYQIVRRVDIKDGLEDFQVRDVERGVRHPVGFNCFSAQKHGIKGIVQEDVKGVVRWYAHTHGVGDIAYRQRTDTCDLHSRSQHKEFRQVNSVQQKCDYENIPSHPYLIISTSEYGVAKKWSWSGEQITPDYGESMLLLNASTDSKPFILDEMDVKEKDSQNRQDIPRIPSGRAAERLKAIAAWARPFVSKRWDLGSRSVETPRRTKSPEVLEEDSSELDASRKAVNPFVNDIASIRRKVDEDKKRKEHSNRCWASKDRFPNHTHERNKLERRKLGSEEEVKELLGVIEDPSLPESSAVMKKSYSSFLKARDAIHAKVNKRLERHSLQRTKTLEAGGADKTDSHTNDRALFLCDIRNIRSNPVITTPKSSRDQETQDKTPYMQTPVIPTPASASAPVAKSGRRLLTKHDSSLVTSREFALVALEDENEDIVELRDLGLSISKRSREKKTSRREAIASIEATMSRFDNITSSKNKKYCYTFNRDRLRDKKKKKKKSTKPSERITSEDIRSAYEEKSTGPNSSDIGAGRYGPYKARDIVAFEEFMSRLPTKPAALDLNSTTYRTGEHFPHVLNSIHMSLAYEMSEVSPIVYSMNNRLLNKLLSEINVRLDGTFLREDIFNEVFSYASISERIRIFKHSMVRAVLSHVFKTLNSPTSIGAEALESAAKCSPSKISSPGQSKSRGGVAFADTSPQNNHTLTKESTAKSLTSDPTKSTSLLPNKNASGRVVASTAVGSSGMEGWTINRSTLESLKLFFDDYYADRNGTVVGSEIIEIAQASCAQLNLERPPNMSFLALRRSFPLSPEVNGDLIAQFFEDVLRVDTLDDFDSFLHQRSNSENSDTGEYFHSNAKMGEHKDRSASVFTSPSVSKGRSSRDRSRSVL